MTQAEEDLLVLTAQNGGRRAFGLLFKKYQLPLLNFAHKLSGDKELAKDAVQDAWIKAAKTLRGLNDPRAFRSWIYRLVRWRMFDLLRKKMRQESQTDSYDATTDLSTPAPNQEEDETLSMAIKQLPSTERQIIYLFYLDDMKLSEISTILEIPIGTVKSRLNRARNLLKKKYQLLEK